MGNYQVRFLGEGAAVMPPPYPTRKPEGCLPARFRSLLRHKAAPDESGARMEGFTPLSFLSPLSLP